MLQGHVLGGCVLGSVYCRDMFCAGCVLGSVCCRDMFCAGVY